MSYVKEWHEDVMKLHREGLSGSQIAQELDRSKSQCNAVIAYYSGFSSNLRGKQQDIVQIIESHDAPRVSVLDIETAPILAWVWRLFNNDVSLNQIHKDWHLMSFTAKWYGEDEKVMYMDQRNEPDMEDDSRILKAIWTVLDQSDIVITQNGKKFDIKKLNSRFIINGMKPPSPFRQIDTCEIAKRTFGFTSNKLEYLTAKLCKKHKKSKHKNFSGFELWKECKNGNMDAWDEMEVYNIDDILSLEELYDVIQPWANNLPNFNAYSNTLDTRCRCGSFEIVKNGFAFTNLGKYQRYTCQDCGAHMRDRTNLLSKEKRATLKGNIV